MALSIVALPMLEVSGVPILAELALGLRMVVHDYLAR
jgi:acetoacetate decarboxylase